MSIKEKEITKLLDLGIGQRAIAARLHIQREKVRYVAQKLGLSKGSSAAFSIRVIGNNEIIHVLPTSKNQFIRLLKLLLAEGGEVI